MEEGVSPFFLTPVNHFWRMPRPQSSDFPEFVEHGFQVWFYQMPAPAEAVSDIVPGRDDNCQNWDRPDPKGFCAK
jgi:hypothetical protein